jgi:predicted Ser/Thr protein kinase
MDCLDANAVQDLMAGAIDDSARSAVLGHLDTCDDCRELVQRSARETLREDSATVGLAATIAGAAATAPANAGLLDTVASGSIALDASQIGKSYGRYQLADRLGAGAMGVVYRAADPELGREVAVKLLHHPDEALTERLVREAQAMAQVSHPNVVTVYDVGKAHGATYIAMELVRGKSLRAWQNGDQPRRPTIGEIVEAYIAAGRGLAAAHAAGIVHRDFKPDNVLVGDDGRVRVTDFGLAAAKPSAGRPQNVGDVELTAEGSVLGTPAYMAPEQFVDGNVDPRTDQFNFCVALYEAIYGERPFDGKTYGQLKAAVCGGKIKTAPASAGASGALRAIVVRGLAVKPGDRFPSMDHLLAELGRDRAKPWRRGAIAAAALAGVLGLGVVGDFVVRERETSKTRAAFESTGKQSERAVRLLEEQFAAFSELVTQLKYVVDVINYREESDFGIKDKDQDAAERQALHDNLISVTWATHGRTKLPLFVVDKMRRVLYSSEGADVDWGQRIADMPAIERAFNVRENSVSIVRFDDPAFTAAKLFHAPRSGLALAFARSLYRGEVNGLYVELFDGRALLDEISLDETQLALVAPDGMHIGGLAEELVRAARPDAITEVGSHLVQARPIFGFDRQPIGSIVMARPLGGVISGLFPAARVAFALAALASLAAAIATMLVARRITGARV